MLDNKKINYFRYDVKAILNSSGIEEEVMNPLLASIVTKANRISIDEAGKYIRQQEKKEILSKETTKVLFHLLDKYKRWR